MKVFATFLASTLATDGIETNSWPANRDAPHCGCQILIDTEKTSNQYINKTCSLSFDYPSSYSNDNVDPHFVSVASSFMVGRDRSGASSQFKFTGYDEVSNAAQLDILVFYEQADCFRAGVQVPENWDDVDQSTIWEYYNMTTQQSADLCNFELTCADTGAVEGVHLGNFNNDMAPLRDAPPTKPLAATIFLLSITIRITMVFWSISNSSPFHPPTTPFAFPCQFTTLTITNGKLPRHGTHNRPTSTLTAHPKKTSPKKFNHVHIRKTQNQHMTTNKRQSQ